MWGNTSTVLHQQIKQMIRQISSIERNSHPLFTIKRMKMRDFDPIGECDTHDEQNDDNTIKCFVNSLGEDLKQQIQVKRKDNMLFTNIFMMFINIEQPQNAELCD